MSLNNKTALVTGGTGGLGMVVVQRLLEEKATVWATYRNEKDLRQLPGPLRDRVVTAEADVTDEKQVIELFDNILKKSGHLEILVNTVGGYVSAKPLENVSVEEWDRMMEVNLKTAFLCTREGVRRMKRQAYGRIVNISAMVGILPTPGRTAYAVSKAGVSLLTEIVAREYKGTGVTINAIAPSIIANNANKASTPNEDYAKWVTPESIADIIVYLCSEPASSVTGTTIRASAGL